MRTSAWSRSIVSHRRAQRRNESHGIARRSDEEVVDPEVRSLAAGNVDRRRRSHLERSPTNIHQYADDLDPASIEEHDLAEGRTLGPQHAHGCLVQNRNSMGACGVSAAEETALCQTRAKRFEEARRDWIDAHEGVFQFPARQLQRGSDAAAPEGTRADAGGNHSRQCRYALDDGRFELVLSVVPLRVRRQPHREHL